MKTLLVLASLVLLVAAGCGAAPAGTAAPTATAVPSDTSAPTQSAAPTAGSPAPTQAGEAVVCMPGSTTGDTSVDAVDFAFEPASVSVSVGQTIAWTNVGNAPHTVTFDDGPNCGRIGSGASVGAEFTAAGTYDYVCTIHPQMTGTVTVEP